MNQEPVIIVKENMTELAKAGADIFRERASKHILRTGSFTVVLAGGSTPRPMHGILAQEPYRRQISWAQTHIFWVDERCVPSNDPASNYGTARKDMLNHLFIDPENIHPMRGELPPAQGALEYVRMLKAFFSIKDAGFPVFDLLYLGIGRDGHVASIFPGHTALTETRKMVIAVKGGIPDVHRLTMSLPLLNHSREIVCMVAGEEKAATLRDIFEGSADRLPAREIAPAYGTVTWLLDRAAASMLSGDFI